MGVISRTSTARTGLLALCAVVTLSLIAACKPGQNPSKTSVDKQTRARDLGERGQTCRCRREPLRNSRPTYRPIMTSYETAERGTMGGGQATCRAAKQALAGGVGRRTQQDPRVAGPWLPPRFAVAENDGATRHSRTGFRSGVPTSGGPRAELLAAARSRSVFSPVIRWKATRAFIEARALPA